MGSILSYFISAFQPSETTEDRNVESTSSNALNPVTSNAGGERADNVIEITNSDPPVPQHNNRCDKCGKKLGLTGAYGCRCGGIYCATHRYSDRHDCTFDYHAMGAEEIQRNNPVVTAEKLRKI